MAADSETEIKLLASPAMLARLREEGPLAGPGQALRLHTTYFDSPDRRLAKAGLALRLREKDGAREQTLKARGADDAAPRRGEWTVKLDDTTPRIDAFPPRVRAKIHKALGDGPLVAIAENRIERTARRLRQDGSLIELAFDSGHIAAGKRRETVSEVELELVRGRLSDVLALALRLPLGPELRWSTLSKGERGDRLAQDASPTAIHAQAPALREDADLVTAFARVAWSCLDHLLGNTLPVVADGDDEAIHQCRVAMRRLLAAWKTFGKHVSDDRLPVLRAGIKASAKTLGAARDLHILQGRLADSATEGDESALSVLAPLQTRQREATQAAQTLLASASFQTLLFELAHWIEAGAWRQQGKASEEPLGPFARRLLAKLQRKLHPQRKPLAAMSSKALHRLRKRAKQFRYAAQFFDGLWGDGKRRKHLLHGLRDLQDELGEIHDLDVAGEQGATLFADHDPIAAAETIARFEQLLDKGVKSREKHLESAEKSLSKLQKIKSFD